MSSAALVAAIDALALALATLAPHLTRYNRSLAGNALDLVANTWD